MEINENHLKNLFICLFLGIISLVLVMNITEELYVSLIISSLIIGFLSTGLGLFEQYDEAITSAIYSFIATFIGLYVFVPLASLIPSYILMYACLSAVISGIISLIKSYFIKQGNIEKNHEENINRTITNNSIDLKECHKFGSKIKKDDKFCEKCGAKLNDNKLEEIYCEKCGSKIDNDSVFCVNCGAKIK